MGLTIAFQMYLLLQLLQPPLQTLVLSLGSRGFLLVLGYGLFHHLQNLLHSLRQQLLHPGIQTLDFGHLYWLTVVKNKIISADPSMLIHIYLQDTK